MGLINGASCGLVAYGIGCALLFFAGYKWADFLFSEDIAQYQRAVAQQRAALQERIISLEREQAETVREIEQRGLDEKAAVDAKYNALLAELDRMRADRPRDTEPVPADTAAPRRAGPPCRCEPLRQNERHSRALELARDCDAQAVKYNQLLDLYKSLRTDDRMQTSQGRLPRTHEGNP